MTNIFRKRVLIIAVLFSIIVLVHVMLKYLNLHIIEGNENMNRKIKPEWEFDSLQKTMYNRLVAEFDKIDQAI